MLKVTDRLLQCLCGASTSCNNQSETSVAADDIWKFQTKLQSIEVLARISAIGISTYNGLSLRITARCWVISARPQAIYPADIC